MKTLLPLLKRKLFTFSFLFVSTLIIATTATISLKEKAEEKDVMKTESNSVQKKKPVKRIKIPVTGISENLKSSAEAPYTATVQTNQADYYPGDTVIITGAGWTAGETVTLHIVSDCGCTNETYIVTADANGNIYNADFIVQEWHLGASFVLTATGNMGNYAETTFTDSPRIGTISASPTSNTVCIPNSGSVTVTYTVTAVRQGNGTVNGTYAVAGLPSGVTGIYSPATFTSNGGSAFPSSTLTLTIQSTASVGSTIFTVSCADGGDQASSTATIVLIKTPVTPGSITGSTLVCAGATGLTYSISAVASATSYT